MAMNDITHIGFTPAQVDAQVLDLATNRQNADNTNIAKVNTKLIDMDELNKDIEDRTTEAAALADSQITQVKNNRELTIGTGLNNLTQEINNVANYYNSKHSVFAGLESTTSLNTKSDDIEAKSLLLGPKLNDMSSNVDPNSFKEVYDLVMANVDVNDPTTVAGFEFSMRKSIAKLADQGAQEKGKCLIYKDENTKSFYEMYIYNGLIALEEVPNPDKDVILSYLTTAEKTLNTEPDFTPTTKAIIPIDNEYFISIVNRLMTGISLNLYAKLLYLDPITKSITILQQVESELNSSASIFDAKYYKNGNSIICIPANDINTYVHTDAKVLTYDSATHSITFSDRPYSSGILAQHGVVSNGNVLAITKSSNGIELYNASTYVNNASITIPAQYSLSKVSATGNYDITSIIMDNDYLYVLAYNITSGTPHILKYLLLDQSLVSNLELTGYKKSVNTTFKFIGGKIALTVNENNIQNKIKLIFLNTTLEVISDSSEYFAPIVLGEGYIPKPVIRDLGSEKILINLGTLTKIYTYDGYQIFSLNETESLSDINALNESTLYYAYYNTDSVALKLNPIYKYR